MHTPNCSTLFSSIVTTSGAPRSEPATRAIAEALIADYHDVIRPTSPTTVDLAPFVHGEVTVLLATQNPLNAPVINSCQGVIIATGDNAFSLLLPHQQPGQRGLEIPIRPGEVLDVEPGYGHTPTMAERIDAVRQRYPRRLEPLTPTHLQALPERAPDPAQIALVVFGTWSMPDGDSPAAVWLLHSYIRDDDIAEGVLLIRPEHGHSEHGSAYGRHLFRMSAGVAADPPTLTLADALDLTHLPYEDALAAITAPQNQSRHQ